MHGFRRRFAKVTATLEPMEATLIADLVDQVRQLLAQRRQDRPQDPLAQLTGITVGPADTPDDPALARLLPDFHAEDAELSAGLRQLREPELIEAKDTAARTLLDTLPPGGGTVRLDEAQANAWMTALNDVRLAMAERLQITDDDEPAAVRADPDGPAAAMYATYRWLSAVLDSLVAATMD
ncbi:DUF2017 domain-containing protein [Nakamurella lactea]|uniref:DUF2017 domain-containing protein n=1 Tax=Nakamurella lactea TaxID=459515 RepID=UPI00041F5515|nr:DUF2017 domain-containing protein [Nakamurella lactea]